LDIGTRVGLFCLEGHVCVRNFGDCGAEIHQLVNSFA
jgi:hypothetical protein